MANVRINKPLVSAIVSIYNSEKFIRGKIEDLLSQTIDGNLEIILVNSGSRQNEENIINEYLVKHSNIIYIKTDERETIYKAWNRGIRVSHGKYITNANTDDRLKRDAFEILSAELEDNPEIALVFANQYISQIPNELFNDINKKKTWVIPGFDYFIQLDRCVVLSQPMWRSSLHFEDNIWFNEKLEICGDHNFTLDIQQKYKIKYLPKALGTFYIDKNRTNKSLQNMKFLEKEKLDMTSSYIINYFEKMEISELIQRDKRLAIKVKIPILLLRGMNVALKHLLPQEHQYTHEFIYFVYALICLRTKQYDKGIYYCNKLLKRKNSERIEKLKQNLIQLKMSM
ncbi:MAG: glycosyltransferase family 2 protein [Melioribacteraceae bacterium]|nr:glycosyltransferase family 2 protein [Melioribacteraceae bacterium]